MTALRIVALIPPLLATACLFGDEDGDASAPDAPVDAATEEAPDIEGRYQLDLELTYDTPCPAFDIPDRLEFTVVIEADGTPGIGSTMPDVLDILIVAAEGSTLTVEVRRDWGAIDDIPVDVTVLHELTVRGARVSGSATTSFYWHGETDAASCQYVWEVEGGRTL